VIWTIDSWDGEQFTVTMTDAAGNVMAQQSWQGNNFANMADETVSCPNSVGGWQDGYFQVSLSADYTRDMGDVTVKVTTTIDQGPGDESIGYGQMNFQYQFDDGRPREWPETSPAVYDPSENPTANWQNNCGAT
jgi:hypothetical protein